MYHKVARVDRRSNLKGHYVSPGLFARHMAALGALGFESVPLASITDAASPMPKRPIAVTFDDGYENFYSNALPVLTRHGFGATVFLVANEIGGTNRWDVLRGDVEENLLQMDSIIASRNAGVEFGSHTLDHVDLTSVPASEARRQIRDSKTLLEEKLNMTVTAFCYPYGRKSTETMRMVGEAEYVTACSTEKGANTLETNPLSLRRINVRSDTWTPVFLLKLLRNARNES